MLVVRSKSFHRQPTAWHRSWATVRAPKNPQVCECQLQQPPKAGILTATPARRFFSPVLRVGRPVDRSFLQKRHAQLTANPHESFHGIGETPPETSAAYSIMQPLCGLAPSRRTYVLRQHPRAPVPFRCICPEPTDISYGTCSRSGGQPG